MDARRLVAGNLKRLRGEKGWSQEEMADHAGLHRTYVSGVERGVRNPTVTVLMKLAQGLNVMIAELVRQEEVVLPAPGPPPLDTAD